MDSDDRDVKKKRQRFGSIGKKQQDHHQRQRLLSIVNPWDVKIASVDPANLLAKRPYYRDYYSVDGRGDDEKQQKLTTLSTTEEPTTASSSRRRSLSYGGNDFGGSSSANFFVRTPWPWYKPSARAATSSSSIVKNSTIDGSADGPSSPTDAAETSGCTIPTALRSQQRTNVNSSPEAPIKRYVKDDERSRQLSRRNDNDNEEVFVETTIALRSLALGADVTDGTSLLVRRANDGVNEDVVTDRVEDDDKSISDLVEHLVRSRYSKPLNQRRLARRTRRSRLLSSIVNQTGWISNVS